MDTVCVTGHRPDRMFGYDLSNEGWVTLKEQFKKIFKQHPEWCTEYDFEGIERPMTMGDVYFIRLKHEPSNKSSMRSAANLNVKNLPAKSTLKKEKKIPYSSTPIRLRGNGSQQSYDCKTRRCSRKTIKNLLN